MPFVFEKEIDVVKSSGSLKIVELPNLAESLAKSVFLSDLFNFGSLVLSLVTDFHFDPIPVTVGSDLNLDKMSELLLAKMETHVSLL